VSCLLLSALMGISTSPGESDVCFRHLTPQVLSRKGAGHPRRKLIGSAGEHGTPKVCDCFGVFRFIRGVAGIGMTSFSSEQRAAGWVTESAGGIDQCFEPHYI